MKTWKKCSQKLLIIRSDFFSVLSTSPKAAQISDICQINLPPRDFSIMTLAGTGLLPNLILFKLSFRAWGLKRCVLSLWHSSLGKFHALIKIQNLFWNLLKQVNANNNLFQHSTAELNSFWSRILMVFHKIFGKS